MTTSEAIPLLRELIRRLPDIRHRPAYNSDYRLWEKEVLKVLAEGFDLTYLARFERFKPQRVRDTDGYESYVRDLDKKKRLLEEIILTHKSLLCGCPDPVAPPVVEPDIIEMRPEDLSALGLEPEHLEMLLKPAEPALSFSYQEAKRKEVAPQPTPTQAEPPRGEPAPEPVKSQPAPQAPAAPQAEPAPSPQAAAAPEAPEPKRAESVALPSEAELRERIREKERLIEEAQQDLTLLRRRLDVLSLVGGLLEAEGENLHELVTKALGQLGVEVILSEERELFVRQNGNLIPLEMEAAQGKVSERAMRRLIGRLPDGAPQGCRVRGLLLGSAHLETPPEERLAADTPCFEERLVEQAKSFDVCLLSLKDVFRLLTGQGTPAQEKFCSSLLNTVGQFNPS